MTVIPDDDPFVLCEECDHPLAMHVIPLRPVPLLTCVVDGCGCRREVPDGIDT